MALQYFLLKVGILSWNFFLHILFVRKIGSRVVIIHFLIQKGFKCTKNPNLKDLWMPRKRAKNGLKIHWISKKLLRLYVNTLRLKNFVYFQVFCKILARIFFWFFEHFDSFLGKKWIQQPLEQFFFNLGMSKKNFSSKFKLWEKLIAAPPGVQTATGKKVPAANSGMVVGMKNI